MTCTSSDGGTTQSASSATSPVTVASLTNANTYTCTAVATNGFGDSAASTASASFVAATVPDAPDLTTVDLGSNAVIIGVSRERQRRRRHHRLHGDVHVERRRRHASRRRAPLRR